jgi:hypothetical protein
MLVLNRKCTEVNNERVGSCLRVASGIQLGNQVGVGFSLVGWK